MKLRQRATPPERESIKKIAKCEEKQVLGQIFVAGKLPKKDATIDITLVDASRQDVEAPVLARTTIEIPAGYRSAWKSFELFIALPEPDHEFPLRHLTIQAEIRTRDGITHINKVSHSVDLTGKSPSYVTVVAEPI